jgi:hypothetical protein
MDGADEVLLRQLIGQVASLDGRVGNLTDKMEEISQSIQDRRSHVDRRISGLEERVRVIELMGAEGKTIPDMLKDHEGRIRSLESIRWQILAVAFMGSGLGTVVIKLLLR